MVSQNPNQDSFDLPLRGLRPEYNQFHLPLRMGLGCTPAPYVEKSVGGFVHAYIRSRELIVFSVRLYLHLGPFNWLPFLPAESLAHLLEKGDVVATQFRKRHVT